MDLDVKLFEQTINEILPNTGVHVRDVNLPKELAEKYVPYTIIKEIGFTDASKRVMGMNTTGKRSLRFCICQTISAGSCFKTLDWTSMTIL